MSEEIILSTASYHDQLSNAISTLGYVREALSQQEACVADVENKYQECERMLQKLSADTKKARKAHEGLRNSPTLRLAHKLAGKKEKYAARESKEEREYVEALEREVKERETFDVLQQLRTEAKIVYNDLTKKAQERQSLKAELSSLYSQIFDGPTSAFSEDDELKEDVENARWRQEQIQARLDGDCDALEILNRADTLMNFCRHLLSEAAEYPRWDIWGGVGMNDYAIRNALSRAQGLANQAGMLVRQAQRSSPSVEDIGRVDIMTALTISSLFVCLFIFLIEQIRSSAAQLVTASLNLRLQRETSASRIACNRAQLQDATEALEQKREELNFLRSRIFARVVSSRNVVPTDDPPPYEEAPPAVPNENAEEMSVPSEQNLTSSI
ncbi:hypothetical protein AX15_004754 [Amanita polypyramis BW_CC]|nr:hypothetical protein AX15_004754 [Amanita polypyramis BW_CC]